MRVAGMVLGIVGSVISIVAIVLAACGMKRR